MKVDDATKKLLDEWCANADAALAGMSVEAKQVLADRLGCSLAELHDSSIDQLLQVGGDG
ncbi:hypothetical protein PVW53_05405 [Seohaeicola sp. SP36]|uniref:hypothetical protein n=1 Tax=unclassified Seohaeicola TaxID=2641111 RepID=UPI00237BD763|nr:MULTISPECIES: hypothetical protein [unclassified Seohaeicola]MDD9708761.1 hypothetical protein [Seohaeicola sp. 4SK31]MDD9734948.1 hypothetical protein [Seohaeicola sp. SP36]